MENIAGKAVVITGASSWLGAEAARHLVAEGAKVALGARRLDRPPVQGPLFDFVPVINQFLQAHLFGDIFELDNLDWQSRELATVGALSAMPGLESQLQAHVRISMNTGLTSSQLGSGPA